MAKTLLWTLAAVVALGVVGCSLWLQYLAVMSGSSAQDYAYDEGGVDDGYYEAFTGDGCNVAGIELHGDLYTYYATPDGEPLDAVGSEDVMSYLKMADDSEHIKAILLEIDSYGGQPVAAQEVADTIRRQIEKPVIVLIRAAGTSAAYWVASAGDYIFASALSDVGGIGVTMSYLENAAYNEASGFHFVEVSSGKFKDYGNPDKKVTDEELALFQRDIDIIHEKFVAAVAENRGVPVEKVQALADGSSMLGEMAKEAGLIDAIGNYFDALDYIEATFEIEPSVCWG